MSIEVERKFLVKNHSWREAASEGVECVQAYLCTDPEKTVRVRIKGDQAYLTIKGRTSGCSRPEFEYKVPVQDAREMLELCSGEQIVKRRYLVLHHGMTWEVDVFEGRNSGLILAEIELEAEDQSFDLPDWVGTEVSGDPRYYNACLSRDPYTAWDN